MSHGAGAADLHHEERPELQHHFNTPEQQFESGKFGMWVFLATEILLFGGLFCAYAIYRALHPEVFVYASLFLDRVLGGINTLVLICSSFTMAWGVRAAQLGQRRLLIVLLGLTILGGLGFMGIKYVEYEHKWKAGLLWGTHYRSQADGHALHHDDVGAEGHGAGPAGHAEPDGHASEPGAAAEQAAPDPRAGLPPAAAAALPPTVPVPEGRTFGDGENASLIPPAAVGPVGVRPPEPAESGDDLERRLRDEPRNVHLFFGIYFTMTGLHALHVIVGMILIGYVMARAIRGDFGPRYFTPVDIVGLYWHLVDLIWIFLFPLLYLIE
ncbi:MAG: hypothetical protein Kow0062_16490 [Acidobacteriota bacterium]